MSFEDAAEAAPINKLYADAQVDIANEAVCSAILEFLQLGSKIVLDDLRQVMLPSAKGGLAKGGPMYSATLGGSRSAHSATGPGPLRLSGAFCKMRWENQESR